MSEGETNPVENIAENFKQYEDVQVHYGCSNCGKLFVSEKLCEEHLTTCEFDSNSSSAKESSESVENIIQRKFEETESECEFIKNKDLDQELKQRYGMIETSSHMLSDNEMLVTLSYNGCITEPLEFCNEIDVDYEQQSENSVNFTQETSSQIYDDIIENSPSALFQENLHTENYSGNLENDEARIITVLNNVDVNQLSQEEVSDKHLLNSTLNFNECDFTLLREAQLESQFDDRIGSNIEEREVENTIPKSVGNKEGSSNLKQKLKLQLDRDKNKNNTIKANCTQNTSDKSRNKSRDPVKGKGKEVRKSKKIFIDIRSINAKFKDVLYREIVREQKDSQASEKPPEEANEFAVFEFYDEEEEERKKENEIQQQIKKDLKRRTCRQCNKVSVDAMAALRHHRENHRCPRIALSKQELEPYLQLEKQTHCPLCLLKLKPYKSFYETHLMTHCDVYAFQCRVCGMKFRRSDHWKNHEKRHVVTPEDLGVVS